MNDLSWFGRVRQLITQRLWRAGHGGKALEVRNRPRRGGMLALLIVGFLVVAVAATGLGARRNSASLHGILPYNPPAAAPTTAAAGAYDLNYLERVSEEMDQGASRVPGLAPQTGRTGDEGQNWDRMIVRTATLQLRVKDVAASMDEIRTVIGGHAGYVTGSESRQEGDYTVGSMTVQVPATQFDSAMSQLRKLGLKVLNENVTSSDVTEEYTDLNSQLRNLQATEARILALMGRAEQINDILTLDRELRGIQGEIERIQGRVNFLGKRAEMSSISISLYPEAVTVEPTAHPAAAWDPVRIASEAWGASLQLLANVGTLVISVVVYLWWLLPLVLAAAIYLRRARRTLPPAPTAAPAE